MDKKGFITIELIIIISSIASLFALSITQIVTLEQVVTKEREINIIQSAIVNARQLAINSKSNVNIIFSDTTLLIQGEANQQFNFQNLRFKNNKSLYYNRNGNINQAYTINYISADKVGRIIFYLGRGWFKIE